MSPFASRPGYSRFEKPHPGPRHSLLRIAKPRFKLQDYRHKLATKMTIITNFTLPISAETLPLAGYPSAPFFITFTTSDVPETGQSWCPDVRAALPHLIAAFSALGPPEMAFVEVGQRPE